MVKDFREMFIIYYPFRVPCLLYIEKYDDFRHIKIPPDSQTPIRRHSRHRDLEIIIWGHHPQKPLPLLTPCGTTGRFKSTLLRTKYDGIVGTACRRGIRLRNSRIRFGSNKCEFNALKLPRRHQAKLCRYLRVGMDKGFQPLVI